MKTFSSVIFLFLVTLCSFSYAVEIGKVSGKPIPRFVSLKSSEVNLRKGPNVKYPIVWTYQRKGYPMKVVAEFENWRKLVDKNGDAGWVHINLLSKARKALVTGNKYKKKDKVYLKQKKELTVFRYPDENSFPMFRAEFGVILNLKSCNDEWCKVSIDDKVGWAKKVNLWGIESKEQFD